MGHPDDPLALLSDPRGVRGPVLPASALQDSWNAPLPHAAGLSCPPAPLFQPIPPGSSEPHLVGASLLGPWVGRLSPQPQCSALQSGSQGQGQLCKP